MNNELKKFYKDFALKYPTIKNYELRNQVNFQNHRDFPVHRWLKYREGYSIELVKNTIQELDIKGAVLDPFLGSGTTTFTSALLGNNSYGVEINPFPAFVAKVKTRKYESKFVQDFEKLLPDLLRKNIKVQKPDLRILDKAFNKEVLDSLLQIRGNINEITNEKQRNLALFIWLSLLEDVSNTFKEGNGIKYKGRFGYKRQPRKGSINYEKYREKILKFKNNEGWVSKNVYEFYKKRFLEVVEDLGLINYNNWEEPIIISGDAKNTESLLKEFSYNFKGIDLTFFSPPYANCFDYFEIFKLELWLGGFVKSYDELREYRRKSLVSNLNANLHNINFKNINLDFLIKNLNYSKLWDKKIVDMLRGYFRDMNESLKEFWNITNKNGYVVIVVANSSYGDIIFPTDVLLAEIGEKVGFKVVKIIEARNTNTSSQQMKKYKELGIDTSFLRESLVYLQKI